MANKTIDEMKRALLGSYDEQGEEQQGLFGYLSAPGQYLRGGLSDMLSWLPGGVPAHGFTGRKMWGEDVLREHLGMENQPGLDMTDVLGTGMDLLVDPLNLLYGAGAIKGGLKAARMLPKLLSSAGRAESLAAAKAAMAGLPAAAKAHAPGLAMGLGVPMAGAQVMGTNEEGSDWKDLVGMGMMTLPMALPLGMAAARKFKGKGSKPPISKEEMKAVYDPIDTEPTKQDAIDAARVFKEEMLHPEGVRMFVRPDPIKPEHWEYAAVKPKDLDAFRSIEKEAMLKQSGVVSLGKKKFPRGTIEPIDSEPTWQDAIEAAVVFKNDVMLNPEGVRTFVRPDPIKEGMWEYGILKPSKEQRALIAEARAALQPEMPLEMP